MGTILVIKNADFSANSIEQNSILNTIKSVLESNYAQNLRYGSNNALRENTHASTNRDIVAIFDASEINYTSFVVTPKSGYKIVPICHDGTTAIFPFDWTTEPVLFSNLDTYNYVGINLSKSDDSNLVNVRTLWDFISVSLPE